MTIFRRGQLLDSSVWNIYRMRERIDINPVYQREGDIWTLEKRQLLIDTIINGFDVPKIYMHKFAEPTTVNGVTYEYAVIDGKQRLTTMWDFIQGKFALKSDFSYLRDDSVDASNFTYADLSSKYPDIKSDLDSYTLQIITIETRDTELIEDMFSRLNEAMPLNAAEKRNARPGPLPAAVRALAGNALFTAKIPFGNQRYRHLDLAAKMLLLASRENVADTKKAYIDAFFDRNAKSTEADIEPHVTKATAVLDAMAGIFVDRDPLLRSVGMIILYFLMFEKAIGLGKSTLITRPKLVDFEDARQANRTSAESDIAAANYKLLEFDRYTQSPNDGVALRFRLAVIDEFAMGGELGFEVED